MEMRNKQNWYQTSWWGSKFHRNKIRSVSTCQREWRCAYERSYAGLCLKKHCVKLSPYYQPMVLWVRAGRIHQANIFRLGSSQLFISYIEAEFKPQVVLFLRWCRIGWWLIQVNKLRLLKFVGDFMKPKETLGNLSLVVLGKPNDSQAHFQMNHVFVRERTLSSGNVKLWNSSSWIFKAMGKMLGRCYTSNTNELFFLFMGALSIKSRTCDNEKWHYHQLPLERSIPCYFKFCKKNIFLFSCVCVIFIF